VSGVAAPAAKESGVNGEEHQNEGEGEGEDGAGAAAPGGESAEPAAAAGEASGGATSSALVVQGESPRTWSSSSAGLRRTWSPGAWGACMWSSAARRARGRRPTRSTAAADDGRRVTCAFFPLRWYQRKFGKGLKPKTHDERQEAALAIQASSSRRTFRTSSSLQAHRRVGHATLVCALALSGLRILPQYDHKGASPCLDVYNGNVRFWAKMRRHGGR